MVPGQQGGVVWADQLRAYVARIEAIESGRAAGDRREVYAEARACGFCRRTLRTVMRRRRRGREAVREEERLVELYEAVLTGA